MKPIVGIFAAIDDVGMHSLRPEYPDALRRAGALPLIITYTEKKEDIAELIGRCDGFLFSGGVDVDPAYYGEEALPELGEVEKKRDELEMLALPEILKSDKPILGICRGMQVINIALGGSLYQDLPSQLGIDGHRQSLARYEASHSVRIAADTPLFSLMGEGDIPVNSFHHQAVKELGRGLVPMAFSDEGLIEAAYLPGERYLRMYQWHPECLVVSLPEELKLFTDFVEACNK